MANSPLEKIVISDIGRGAQLKYGPGNNQYCRASDFNPVVDYVNDRAGVNASTITQATSITTGVTLNSISGVITMFATSIVTGTPVSFTLTNANITASSIVLAQVVQGGAAGSAATVASVVPAAGSATITVVNNSATATGANSVKIAFVIF